MPLLWTIIIIEFKSKPFLQIKEPPLKFNGKLNNDYYYYSRFHSSHFKLIYIKCFNLKKNVWINGNKFKSSVALKTIRIVRSQTKLKFGNLLGLEIIFELLTVQIGVRSWKSVQIRSYRSPESGPIPMVHFDNEKKYYYIIFWESLYFLSLQ